MSVISILIAQNSKIILNLYGIILNRNVISSNLILSLFPEPKLPILSKSQIQVQFSTCDGNAISRNYWAAVARQNFSVQNVLCWQCRYFRKIKNSRAALHVKCFTCDGNTISRNYCIAVAPTNFYVWHILRRQCNSPEN